MALKYGGTTVKKLVHNGTTCKKGIYNGTTVFNAETVFFDSSTSTGWQSYGYSGDTHSIGSTLHGKSGNAISLVSFWRSVDLTNIKTLKFTFSSASNATGEVECGVTDQSGSGINCYGTPWLVGVWVGGAGTYTADVSSISGWHNIAVALVCNSSGNNNFTVTKIIGE